MELNAKRQAAPKIRKLLPGERILDRNWLQSSELALDYVKEILGDRDNVRVVRGWVFVDQFGDMLHLTRI